MVHNKSRWHITYTMENGEEVLHMWLDSATRKDALAQAKKLVPLYSPVELWTGHGGFDDSDTCVWRSSGNDFLGRLFGRSR